MDQGEIRRGSRRGCDGEIRLSEGNGIDRYNEDTGVEIFADPLEWSRRTGIVDSKRILQLDVWNIKTPMLDILGDGEIEPNSRMLVRAGHEINILLLFPPRIFNILRSLVISFRHTIVVKHRITRRNFNAHDPKDSGIGLELIEVCSRSFVTNEAFTNHAINQLALRRRVKGGGRVTSGHVSRERGSKWRGSVGFSKSRRVATSCLLEA